MQLSGTSMSAPIVSGAVALLLQGTPGLSAAQVKLALQSGATYVRDGGLMGAGAGSLNIWASRQIAANGLVAADRDAARRAARASRAARPSGTPARCRARLYARPRSPAAVGARLVAGLAEPGAACRSAT